METLFKDYFNDMIVEFYNDYTYTLNSSDNIHNYKFEYLSEDSNIFYSKYGIVVRKNNVILNSAILLANGGHTSIHKKSYFIDEDYILICCGNTLFSLSLPELVLKWNVAIDSVTAFGIYKMNSDYIIHGELEISRINKHGKIIWQKNGSDIFVTIDGNNDFEINEGIIYAKSWDGRKYKFNYYGEDIK